MDNHTEPADSLAIAADVAEAAADLLPLDMLAAVADLVDPAAVAREMPWLAGELANIALGRSDISFDQRDQRFSDQAWRTVPYFRILGQSYRLFEMWMNRMQESVDGSWQDFGKIGCDSYHVGGYTDHITAWRACYDTAHLVGGSDKEMTLIRSGHIQSVVYPPDSKRYDRWYAPPTPTDPDEWLSTAPVEKGSWWRPWTEWLIARSGPERQAPATFGNRQYPPLGPAPGTYVYQ